MKRLMLAVCCLFFPLIVLARPFPIPATAMVGVFLPAALPMIVIGGERRPSTPALRIYDKNGLIVMSSNLPRNVELLVRYTVDMQGQVNQIWILNDEETRALPKPKVISPG